MTLHTTSIQARLITLIGVLSLFTVLLIGALAFGMVRLTRTGADATAQGLLEGERTKLQVAVHSLARSLGQQIEARPPADTAALVRDATASVRFGPDSAGYFFAYRGTEAISVPPLPAIEGTDASALVDSSGVYYVREMRDRAAEGGGFTRYTFPKPGAGAQPKLSYSEPVPGTDIWIGTGVYMDDVHATRAAVLSEMRRTGERYVVGAFAALGLLFLVVGGPAILWFIRSVVRPLEAAADAAHRIAAGNLDTALPETRAGPTRNEAELLVRAFNAMVTDLAEKDRALRASAEQYRTLIEQALVGVYVIRDGRFEFVNAQMARIFGYDPDEIAGLQVMELVAEEDRPTVRENLRARISGELDSLRYTFHGIRKDGSKVLVEVHGARLDTEQGAAVYGMLLDITDRERALAAVRESEERFRQLTANIRGAFYMATADHREKLYASPGYADIFGIDPETLKTEPEAYLRLVVEEDRERVRKSFHGPLTSPAVVEYRIDRPDGEERWILDRAFPVRDDDGSTYRIAGIAEDITEQKRLEEQLRHSQKLDAVGQLAGGVAHDFNNMLTAIGGLAALMLEAGAEPGQEEDLREIMRVTDRATDLTRQLLAFGRRQVLRPEVLDLNRVMEQTTKMLRRLIGENIELVTRPSVETPLIEADPGQIEQVLMNLAVNARDAMPKGGRLTIEASTLPADDVPSGDRPGKAPGCVRLRVMDTGTGIDEAVLPRIFEPFFTTKEVGAGTGLGLATVHGIVEQSGGTIRAESEPGEGTTFTILLPLTSRPRPEPAAPSTTTDHAVPHATILVVEDEAVLRSLCRRVLQNLGYEVLLAGDGVEGLQVAREHPGSIDVVIADVVMPKLSGPAMVDGILRFRPDIQVLYVSGYSEDGVLHYGIEMGEVNLLSKPYTPAGLRDLVASLVRKAGVGPAPG